MTRSYKQAFPLGSVMARLKFLLYALLVLGLWAAHLALLTPAVSARAVEQAMAHAQAARPLASAQVLDRRQELQRVAMKVQNSDKYPAAIAGFPGKAALAPEKLEPLRALAAAQAPESLRAGLVVGYTNEGGGTFYRGAEVAEGLDSALGQAGQDGIFQEAFGTGHLWVSLPVWDYRPAGPSQVGAVVLGAPLISPEALDALARESGLAGAGLFQAGRLIAGAGADKAVLERAAKSAQLDGAAVVERGAVGNLGPLRLPLFTSSGGGQGGDAPILVASRRAVEETPYELVAIASVKPVMSALGGYQRLALMALFGLFVLSVAWTLIMGSGGGRAAAPAPAAEPGDPHEAQAPTDEGAPPPVPEVLASSLQDPAAFDHQPPAFQPEYQASAPMEAPPEPYGSPAAQPLEGAPLESDALDDGPLEGASEAGTEVRPFPPGLGPDAEANHQPPDPFDQFAAPSLSSEPPPPPAAAAAPVIESPFGAPGVPQDGAPSDTQPFEDSVTRAYPVAAATPFSTDPSEPPPEGDNPDATRVAAIPPELLEASARNTKATGLSGARNLAVTVPAAPPPPRVAAAMANPEEAHFQEIYREFVATRERCGEPADGLTYDKFAQKLRKNKEQLVQKYACKTVRFQVYVKEGKAALKATPAKE